MLPRSTSRNRISSKYSRKNQFFGSTIYRITNFLKNYRSSKSDSGNEAPRHENGQGRRRERRTWSQRSQVKGRKSIWLQSPTLQCLPRLGNSGVPIPELRRGGLPIRPRRRDDSAPAGGGGFPVVAAGRREGKRRGQGSLVKGVGARNRVAYITF